MATLDSEHSRPPKWWILLVLDCEKLSCAGLGQASGIFWVGSQLEVKRKLAS